MKTKAKSVLLAAMMAAVVPLLKAAELTITPSGSQVIVGWPQGGPNDFYLRWTTNLLDPSSWRPTADPVVSGAALVVTNDTSGASRFYGLQAWEALFDGTTAAHFRGYQMAGLPGTNIWKINTNRELEAVASGTQVDLITTNQYDDFELRWEWKTSVNGNSGINYRATELYSRAEWSGPEYQLLDTNYATVPQNSLGAVWSLIAPTNKTTVPTGQWNQCRLVVQGNQVEHWLNGNKVVSYALDSPAFTAAVSANSNFNPYPQFARARMGYIALRHENTPVWFRNIKIRKLPAQ